MMKTTTERTIESLNWLIHEAVVHGADQSDSITTNKDRFLKAINNVLMTLGLASEYEVTTDNTQYDEPMIVKKG